MNCQTPAFDLVIGMDRSDRKIDLHLLDLSAHTEQSATHSTDPAFLQAWVVDLRKRFPQHRPVAIVFEQPANNLIGFLSQYDWITLYPINPTRSTGVGWHDLFGDVKFLPASSIDADVCSRASRRSRR